jgi:hypothetical protein
VNKAVVEKDAAQLKVNADISASCAVAGYMLVFTDTAGGMAGISATSSHLRRAVPT